MSVSDADEAEAIQLVGMDVQSTLGPSYMDYVAEIAARVRGWNPELDRDAYVIRVAERIQEDLHCSFVHTTWPPCPLHQHHPLWLWNDIWVCEQTGERVASLGEYGFSAASAAGFVLAMDDGLPDLTWSPYLEQRRYGELPTIDLSAIDTREFGEVALTCIPGTIQLPSVENAKTMEVPEEAWQGWQWSSGDQLLLLIDRDIGRYTTGFMHSSPVGCELIYVAGAPMIVRRTTNAATDRFPESFQAEINGFFDAKTAFWAQVGSGDVHRRNALIASVAALRLAPET